MKLFLCLLMFVCSVQASQGWNDHADLFAQVSVQTGVDVSELAVVAAIESSFRPQVKAATSSATGLFQFTDRTWRVTVRQYGHLYGLSRQVKRTDPLANALMGAEYIKENRRVLTKKLNRYPSLADVYMAHLIAPRRVAAIEDINPQAYMAYLYPTLAKYNRNLFYTVQGRPYTVKQFKQLIGTKVWRTYHQYKQKAKVALARYTQYQRLALIKAVAGQQTQACLSIDTILDNIVPRPTTVTIARPFRLYTGAVWVTSTPAPTTPHVSTRSIVADRRWVA